MVFAFSVAPTPPKDAKVPWSPAEEPPPRRGFSSDLPPEFRGDCGLVRKQRTPLWFASRALVLLGQCQNSAVSGRSPVCLEFPRKRSALHDHSRARSGRNRAIVMRAGEHPSKTKRT